MALTPSQLQTLKAAIAAETDVAFVEYRTNGQTDLMRDWYNTEATPTLWVSVSNVSTALVGKVINYVAFSALTTANRDRLTGFMLLNPITFDGTKADVKELLSADTAAGIFSGALGGQGADTRAAMDAIMRRAVTRCERLYVTGAGTAASPGLAGFVGKISSSDISAALAA